MAQLRYGSNRSGGGSSGGSRGGSGYTDRKSSPSQRYEPRGGTTSLKKQVARGRVQQQGSGVKYKSNSTGSYGAVPAMPPAGPGPVPDINGYLGGDSSYQNQIRQLAKALSDFNTDSTRRRSFLESDYGTSKKALGDQKGLDLKNIEEDYGSRGLIHSGLYGTAVGDYNTEFNERMADLDRKQQQALQMLEQEASQYTQQNTLSQQQAREEALRRRAEQYGI